MRTKKIKPKALFVIAVTLSILTIGVVGADKKEAMKMILTSPDFHNNSIIPTKFTCQGEDVNPAFVINGIPEETKSMALIVDDPDAPGKTWVHWVVFDIPVIQKIDESSIPGKQGVNDFGVGDYRGPCPPSGTHRYFFKIYALDKILGLKEGISKEELEEAIKGHALDKAHLIGLYKKR